jgi:hypothetical protein
LWTNDWATHVQFPWPKLFAQSLSEQKCRGLANA